ncbi:uncharacterized protein PgNI_08003 [Pyricularia grisea]|uniref:BZIP domain-containing protein n=1 Tax=Pyricularia grisea TaxID=148305 RepID=A0A6P8AVG7_PYRGI|nr:uncharacterized protein PgNI_08003 [Pyricularia grisea]TLD06159.1 hypothetical protein PgNI_08003 [Pyricularia grisea]
MTAMTTNRSQPYALPANGEIELCDEDDWTRVKDRKEKKRMQNRVAQRTYRYRMKQRLGELQSRLDQQNSQNAASSAGSVANAAENGRETTAYQPRAHADTADGLLQRSQPNDESNVAQFKMAQQQQQHHHHILHTRQDYIDPKMMSKYSQPGHTFENCGQPIMQLSNLEPIRQRPPTGNQVRPELEQHGFQAILQEGIRYQMQLLDRMSAEIPEGGRLELMRHREQLVTMLQNNLGIGQDMNNGAANFAADANDMIDFDFGTTDDDCQLGLNTPLSQGQCTSGQQQTPSPDHGFQQTQPQQQQPPAPTMQPTPPYQNGTLDTVFSQPAESSTGTLHSDLSGSSASPRTQAPDGNCQGATAHTTTNAENGPSPRPSVSQITPISSPQQPPEPTAAIDERLEYMIDCAEAAGFDSLDCLVEAYYSSTLTEPQSYLSSMRRLSRNRRLPKLLSTLFESSLGWSEWERRELFGEIFKMAETLLISEGREKQADGGEGGAGGVGGVEALREALGLIESLGVGAAGPGGDPQDSRGGAALSQKDVKGLKLTAQGGMPNLWALVMALTSGDKGLRHRDRSEAVLATIITLFCAGRMPKESLFRVLDSIL